MPLWTATMPFGTGKLFVSERCGRHHQNRRISPGIETAPVHIRRSMHSPPRPDAVRELMPTFFELLQQEEEPAVRVVLGHFIFVWIHPYFDGNGRMGALFNECYARLRRLSLDNRAPGAKKFVYVGPGVCQCRSEHHAVHKVSGGIGRKQEEIVGGARHEGIRLPQALRSKRPAPHVVHGQKSAQQDGCRRALKKVESARILLTRMRRATPVLATCRASLSKIQEYSW